MRPGAGFAATRFDTPDGTIALVFEGELDIATGHLAREALDDVRNEPKPVLLVLDRLDFLDLTGLRVLLDTAAAAQATDRLAMTRGSEAVRRLVELTEVGDLLPWVETRVSVRYRSTTGDLVESSSSATALAVVFAAACFRSRLSL